MKEDDRYISDYYKKFVNPVADSNKIVLCRPYAVLSAKTYSAAITLPMGIAYLAAVLERANYPVQIIDAIGLDLFSVRRSVCATYNMQGLEDDQIIAMIKPDTKFFGISLMFSQEWIPHRNLLKKIKLKFPDLIIIAGGEHPTALSEYVLRDCKEISYVISGEGEFTLLELIHKLSSDMQIDQIGGVCYLDKDGSFKSNGLSRRIAHIDHLPRPAWHLFNVEPYFSGNWTMGISMGRNMPVLGTRGCPYQCTFCSNPTMWTTRYTMRNAVEVVDEIEWLQKEYKADTIEFYDLTAIVKKEWILQFCSELMKRGVKINWQLPSGTRSEALDPETLRAIYESGCKLLVYAPESGSEESLRIIKKKLKIARLNESVRAALEIGHTVKINLIIGFPNEKLGDIFKTIFYGIKMAWIGVHDCNFAVFTPYPGSELYRELVEEKVVREPCDEYFRNLLVQFDLTVPISYSRYISGHALAYLRIFALSAYYLTAYIRYPKRLLRLARIIRNSKFQPNSVFEQRVHDFIMRNKIQVKI
jgi:radical SAM superfamily enzyme YgiQ (UPF0313 family)